MTSLSVCLFQSKKKSMSLHTPLLLTPANFYQKSQPKGNWKEFVPVEVYPLFVASFFAVGIAGYTIFGKFTKDPTLRLKRQGKAAHAEEAH